MGSASLQLEFEIKKITESISQQMASRGARAANQLMNAKNETLRGTGGGRQYRIPNTGGYYTASAPGEVPASRTGNYRARWNMKSYTSGKEVHSEIESNVTTDNGGYVLGSLLEDGTSKMAPRPHQEKILEKAKPNVLKIYAEPYV